MTRKVSRRSTWWPSWWVNGRPTWWADSSKRGLFLAAVCIVGFFTFLWTADYFTRVLPEKRQIAAAKVAEAEIRRRDRALVSQIPAHIVEAIRIDLSYVWPEANFYAQRAVPVEYGKGIWASIGAADRRFQESLVAASQLRAQIAYKWGVSGEVLDAISRGQVQADKRRRQSTY